MAGFSDYLENKLLDLVFGSTAYSIPATVYLGLSVGDPTDAGTLTGEPSGSAYARVSVTNNTTNFANSSEGVKLNGVTFTFPKSTGAWGTVTHFFISDAATVGNMLASGELTESKAITSGDTINFLAESITITLD